MHVQHEQIWITEQFEHVTDDGAVLESPTDHNGKSLQYFSRMGATRTGAKMDQLSEVLHSFSVSQILFLI